MHRKIILLFSHPLIYKGLFEPLLHLFYFTGEQTMQIYRPYVSIKESAKCLHSKDLYISGCINCPEILMAIFSLKKWINFSPPKWILSHPLLLFYYNNGKPYVKDLLEYHTISKELWLAYEGAPNNHIQDIHDYYETIEKYCSNAPHWNTHNARYHKLALLKSNYFWYKRHFIDYKKYDLSKFKYDFFVKNKPNKIFKKDLLKMETKNG